MNENRLFNIAKALGIISIVIGHTDSPIGSFVGLYHVVIFVFVSGYFYKDEYTNNVGVFIKKKIKGLYIPYLGFYMVFITLHNLFININIYSLTDVYSGKYIKYYNFQNIWKELAKSIFFIGQEPLLGALWFLSMMFIVSISFSLISKLVKNKFENREYMRFIIILIIFIISNVLTKIDINIPRINPSLSMILFYYMGYLFKKKFEEYSNYYRKIKNIIPMKYFIGMTIVLLGMSTLYGGIEVNSNNYLSPYFLIANSILGVNLVLFLSYYIDNMNNKISTIFNKIGKCSFWIMALHFTAFKVVEMVKIYIFGAPNGNLSKFPVSSGKGVWWIVYSGAGVFLPIIIYEIIKKIRSIKVIKDENINAK